MAVADKMSLAKQMVRGESNQGYSIKSNVAGSLLINYNNFTWHSVIKLHQPKMKNRKKGITRTRNVAHQTEKNAQRKSGVRYRPLPQTFIESSV
jgi:putative heme iron utilization protein